MTANNELIASARLSIHNDLKNHPDGYLWIRAQRSLPSPIAHFCKLVVHYNYRKFGLGFQLNVIRLKAAKEMRAKSIALTASEKNSRLLYKLGFCDTGIREIFSNRPSFEFKGLELVLT